MTLLPGRFAAPVLASLLLLWLLCFPAGTSRGQTGALPPAGGVAVLGFDGLSAGLHALFDPSGTLDFDAASAPQRRADYRPLAGALNAGYSGGVWWLRIDIAVPAAYAGQTALLQAWMPDLDDVRFRTADGREHANGAIVPIAERSARLRIPTVEVRLAEPVTTVYLRLKASGTATLIPRLLSPLALLRSSELQMLYLGALGGALLIVMVIALVNAWVTREPIYRIYAGLTLTAGLAVLSRNGFINAGLVPSPDWLIPLIALPITLLAMFAILFSSRILHIDSRHPRLFRMLQWLAILLLAAYGLQFTGHSLFVNQLLMLVMLAYGVLSLAVSGYDLVREPDRTGAFIFTAYAVFMGAQIVSILAALGTLPATLQTVEAWQYGTWVHLLLLHVALVSGLREERRAARENELGVRIARAELAEQRRASEEKSRFIEMLAHEINTPLAVIDSTVQSLEMLPGADSQDQRSRHARIRASVRRVSRLINETASRDRLDNGAWQVRLAEFSAAELIAGVIDPLDPVLALGAQGGTVTRPAEVGGQTGDLEISIAPGMPRLRADARLAEIALSNLLDNARKYGAPGSRIRVEARPSLPDPQTHQPGIELSVHSVGYALPAPIIEQLFQKYFRGPTHPEVPGLGLGLYLVRSIAELHGGRAGAEPAEGPGLRFWICLPHDETQ